MRRVGLLVVLGVLVVTGAWWMFLISPRNGDIADLKGELNVAVDTQQRLQVQIRQLEEIRDSEVQYLAALGQLDSLIPERPLLEDFIEQIFALTNETGVELQTLTPSLPAAVEGSELRNIAVSVQIEGEFFEVLGFLFGLSDMERLVRVDSIAVSSSVSDAGETMLSAGIQLRLFTLADLVPIEEVENLEDPDGGSDAPESEARSEPADVEAAGGADS
ncbi:MAG: type 4a pilus biogenesis protein PilO [Acidimicrobiia bacterium]